MTFRVVDWPRAQGAAAASLAPKRIPLRIEEVTVDGVDVFVRGVRIPSEPDNEPLRTTIQRFLLGRGVVVSFEEAASLATIVQRAAQGRAERG